MNGIPLIAVPSVLLAGALTVPLSRAIVPRLPKRPGEKSDPALASAWTAVLVCGLALIPALIAWRSPVLVLFGPEQADRWGLHLDALSGPMLAATVLAFLLAAAAGLASEDTNRTSHSLLLAAAFASVLLVLAQNLWMLAVVVELSVVLSSLLVLHAATCVGDTSLGLRYFAVAQVGGALLIAALFGLGLAERSGVAGYSVPLAAMQDAQSGVALSAPHTLASLLSVLAIGFLVCCCAGCVLFLGPRASQIAPGVRMAVSGGWFLALTCAFLRVGFQVLPFAQWERAPGIVRTLAAALGIAGAVGVFGADRPGPRHAWMMLGQLGGACLITALASKEAVGLAAVAFIAVGLSRCGAVTVDASPPREANGRRADMTGVAAAVGLAASAVALLAAFSVPGWRLGGVLTGLVGVALLAEAVRLGWQRASERGAVQPLRLVIAALAAAAAVAVVAPGVSGRLARGIVHDLRLERQFISKPMPLDSLRGDPGDARDASGR